MKTIHVPLIALAAILASCGGGGGGGGGGGLNSTPFPTPTPTPTPTPLALNASLFANPVDGPVVVLAVGQVRDTANATFVPLAIDASAGFDLRYIAAENRYEISGNGITPSTLIRYDPVFDASDPYRNVKIADNCCGDGFTGFVVSSLSAASQYKDAAIMTYQIIDPGPFGDRTISGVAGIGMATPAAAIPTTGTATFAGYVEGAALLPNAANASAAIPLFGGVSLTMDFGAGSVGGSMNLADATDPNFSGAPNLGSFGSFMLNPTSLSSSGAFNTGFVSTLSGTNLFQGQLAGPTAGEAFGRFAVPFQYDGTIHQAGGAWVAKR